jgi:hypothetical protein
VSAVLATCQAVSCARMSPRCGRLARMAEDNDVIRAVQRKQEAERSWVTVAEYAVATALATDVYNDVKAAGKAVVGKIRKPSDPPPPSGSDGGA